MNNDKIALDDILIDHVKGDGVVWDGAQCFYKAFEIITLFGTAVWVRNAMPDNRDNWLKVETPDFFERFDKSVSYAKGIVDEVIKTDWALGHYGVLKTDPSIGTYGKPSAGRVG